MWRDIGKLLSYCSSLIWFFLPCRPIKRALTWIKGRLLSLAVLVWEGQNMDTAICRCLFYVTMMANLVPSYSVFVSDQDKTSWQLLYIVSPQFVSNSGKLTPVNKNRNPQGHFSILLQFQNSLYDCLAIYWLSQNRCIVILSLSWAMYRELPENSHP